MLHYPINVTLDTNIFFANHYDFGENSTLKLLIKYVKDGKIKVVLSNIVVREATNQVAKQASGLCGIARSFRGDAIKLSTEHFISYIGLGRLLELPDKRQAKEKSIELLNNYIKDINAEILGLDLIDLNSIVDDYFAIKPPFQEGEKKRKEFPDAFIANQIRKRFGDNEAVFIISDDNGFKAACGESSNHIFLGSLGELYNKINKQDDAYKETIDILRDIDDVICDNIGEYISLNENITVFGSSVDKDGIVEGYDYTEVIIDEIGTTSFRMHSVDDLSEDSSIITLWGKANIVVDCYYEDYDNSPWDPENKEYIYTETVKIKEHHHSKFVCRIKLNRKTKEVMIMPFNVILGGDTRVKRERIKNDYSEELHDMDRESLGFISLQGYDDYLEEALSDSKMQAEVIDKFEKINSIYRKFEEYSTAYDSLIEKLNDPSCDEEFINILIKTCSGTIGFPDLHDCCDFESIKEEICKWINMKFETISEMAEKRLPDVLNFGESISIDGVDGNQIVLQISELSIKATEGDKETIDIRLISNGEEVANGYIKLTVGYLNFDEDGGASDGLSDDLEFCYEDIIYKLDEYIKTQIANSKKEEQLANAITAIL